MDVSTLPHQGPRGRLMVHRRGMLRIRLVAVTEGRAVGSSSLQLAAAAAAAAVAGHMDQPPTSPHSHRPSTPKPKGAASTTQTAATATAPSGQRASLSAVVSVVAARSSGAGMVAPVGQMEVLASHQLVKSRRQRHGHTPSQLALATAGYTGSHKALRGAVVGGLQAAARAEERLEHTTKYSALPEVQRGAHRREMVVSAPARDLTRGTAVTGRDQSVAPTSHPAAEALAGVLSKSQSAGLIPQAVLPSGGRRRRVSIGSLPSASPRSSARPMAEQPGSRGPKLSFLDGGRKLAASARAASTSALDRANLDFVKALVHQQGRLKAEWLVEGERSAPDGKEVTIASPSSESKHHGQAFNFKSLTSPAQRDGGNAAWTVPGTPAARLSALHSYATRAVTPAQHFQSGEDSDGSQGGLGARTPSHTRSLTAASNRSNTPGTYLKAAGSLFRMDEEVSQQMVRDMAATAAQAAQTQQADAQQRRMQRAKSMLFSRRVLEQEAAQQASRSGQRSEDAVAAASSPGAPLVAPLAGTSPVLEAGVKDDANIQAVLGAVPVGMRLGWEQSLAQEAKNDQLLREMRKSLQQQLQLPQRRAPTSTAELMSSLPTSPSAADRGAARFDFDSLPEDDASMAKPAAEFMQRLLQEDQHMHFLIGLERQQAAQEEEDSA